MLIAYFGESHVVNLSGKSHRCCACSLIVCNDVSQPTASVVCRNAYIMVAVHGTGYCSSAFHAAKLILNNILRIAAVSTVGDILLWLGKVGAASANFVRRQVLICAV